ncbi:oxygenase MpaB family protein [Mucilaginibacter sp.]|uniref:oxygenase MpaB family protein n=1 Tax=Mucilaginibacter sp. TaxID=1882438 RepID=UPI0035BC8BD2
MPVKYFVEEQSIVRKIWGKADTVLFIFAGAAAEFALNKAVDWLYFTGKLPADPLARLFSTVTYSRQILFSTEEDAYYAINQITAIHKHVEGARGAQIPDWAYRDVLFMLIDYTIRSFELLDRKLSLDEKQQVFETFYKLGLHMGLRGLPQNYTAWLTMRQDHLEKNLQYSPLTADLFKQYRKHLGGPRYWLMCKVQALLVPARVKEQLKLKNGNLLNPLLYAYKLFAGSKLSRWFRDAILPAKYKSQIVAMDS